MPIRKLPDLSPKQVIRLQDALLSNADALLTSALTIFDLGHETLARSLAVLGLEESGKAIALHNRRVAIVRLPEGEPFRCEHLDKLWGDHLLKLDEVYRFLVDEPYWFGTGAPNPEENERVLGTLRRWRNHDNLKQRGFYVDVDKVGDPLTPAQVSDESSFRELVSRVHQIGWQLRLGEHIEGKQQDEQEEGLPAWDPDAPEHDYLGTELRALLGPATPAQPGTPLKNAAYRFNAGPPDPNPFSNLGKPGYEAQTRELRALAREIGPSREEPHEDPS